MYFRKKLLTVLCTAFLITCFNKNIVAQPAEVWGGATGTVSTFRNFRPQRAYDQGFPNPEIYTNLGLYFNSFDGSFLCWIFDDKRLMVGDYLRFGVGLGYVNSNAYVHINEEGMYNVGRSGVYGNDLWVPGPLDKTRFGYFADFNYGFQLQYHISGNNMIGIRYYHRLHANPIVNFADGFTGYSIGGVMSIFGGYKNFSALLEFDPSKKGNYNNASNLAATLRKHNKEKKHKFIGIRLEYTKGQEAATSFNISRSYTSAAIITGVLLGTQNK